MVRKWLNWTASGAQAHKSPNAAKGVKPIQLNRAVGMHSHQPCRPSVAHRQEIRIKCSKVFRKPDLGYLQLTCSLRAMYKQYCSLSLWRKEFLKRDKIVHLEGIFKDHSVQLSDHFRANQKLQHTQEDIAHVPLERWQPRTLDTMKFQFAQYKGNKPLLRPLVSSPQLDLSLAKNKYSSFVVDSKVS